MHDPSGVSLRQALAHLDRVFGRALQVQSALQFEEPGEAVALEVLHHHVRAVRGHACVEHASHVLALQLRGRLRLPGKPGQRLGVCDELSARELDRDWSIEMKVRRGNHEAHPALGQHPVDAEFTSNHLPHERMRTRLGRWLHEGVV